jgi:oligopeptide/dipeptide ABC transporter ATP-binding protein
MNSLAVIENLKVHYPIKKGFLGLGQQKFLKAVDGVSLELRKGEILGLVGESGCGKSSLGKSILRLIEPTDGKIEIDGKDFLSIHGKNLRRFRPHIQMVFQDPYASLNPRMTVFDILEEPLKAHRKWDSATRFKKIQESLSRVGLSAAHSKKYPHEFSGGQRQRIAIARALILDPKIIVADEPVSSLDVSVQAQILNLLKDIQTELGLAMIFISHNLAVVKYIADRIAVMYLGKIVEIAPCEEIYKNPQHPYTQALVSAVPIPDPKKERSRSEVKIVGELPSPLKPPVGCAFHARCPIAVAKCGLEIPKLKPTSGFDNQVSCFEVEKKYAKL